MAMGSLSDDTDDFNPEINTTPLVDVMLVLLIIFIITMPVVNHAVKVNLPHANSQPAELKPDNIELSITANGQMSWNGQAIDEVALRERIAVAAAQQPVPALHLRAERSTPYERVAQLMSTAQAGGLTQIGFVTEPTP
jgi:biopolymer transport protein ExbD